MSLLDDDNDDGDEMSVQADKTNRRSKRVEWSRATEKVLQIRWETTETSCLRGNNDYRWTWRTLPGCLCSGSQSLRLKSVSKPRSSETGGGNEEY